MEDITVQNVAQPTRANPVTLAAESRLGKERLQEKKQTQSQETPQAIQKSDFSVSEMVDELTKIVDKFTTKIAFTYDKEAKEPVIIVREKDSGKVIRQIPPEEVLALKKKMQEIAGIIYNGRA